MSSLCEVSSVISAIELFPTLQGKNPKILYMKNEGNIHDSYDVRFSNESSYVLQRINDRVFTNPVDLMGNLGLVLNFLAQKKTEFASSLQFLPTQLGTTWIKNDSGTWRVMPFLGEYGRLDTSPPTLLHARQSARAFGLFCKYLSDFNADLLIPLLPGFHDTCEYLETFQKLVLTDPQNRSQSCREEIDILQELSLDIDLGKLLQLLKKDGQTFPLRVIHGDAKYSNVVLSEDGTSILSVIDLDTVMKAPILYDLGDFLRTVCPNICEENTNIGVLNIRKDYYQECVRCYLDGLGNTIDAIELGYLYMSLPLVAYELSIRFLSDYLQGDFYFKTNRPRHNLDRARNQLQLVKEFLKERAIYESLHATFFIKKNIKNS